MKLKKLIIRIKDNRKFCVVFSVLLALIVIKAINTRSHMQMIGSSETEKTDILKRSQYLKEKLLVNPDEIINMMPRLVGEQFQGEWALYSCSMYTQALVNIAYLYPETKSDAIVSIEKLIESVKSPELKFYDFVRWGEDPLDNLDSSKSHISYLSHLAWMIGNYKMLGGGKQYDSLYHDICSAMNRRITDSQYLNVPTYPGEIIYVPDMCVAIVALKQYSYLNKGKYMSTVERWVKYMKTEAERDENGFVPSFISETSEELLPIKGSYTALNCYYLTMIDKDLAQDQYEKLKTHFIQKHFVKGLKEYNNRFCPFGLDIDAGPIIMNLSPSGTAFAVGPLTYFHDDKLRKMFMSTAEIAGQTVSSRNKSHYLLANFALVGECIMLAMRTTGLSVPAAEANLEFSL